MQASWMISLLSALFLFCPAMAWGGQVNGRVVDARDGAPLSGVQIYLEGVGTTSISDFEGAFSLSVPPGVWRLHLQLENFADLILANQRAGDPPSVASMWPLEINADFVPGPRSSVGLLGTGLGPKAFESVRLDEALTRHAVPGELPATIRVARYLSVGCEGEIQRIDTLDFEDYVKGVVYAEVGVFARVEGGPEAAAECWKAFAVAARSYALHFILTQSYETYDINDTACNQVYHDERGVEVSAAVDATRGQILVKASDPDVIDRYFYAASCAEHGTEPGYAVGTILPDPTPVRACVGNWCGHDNCAGHRDNPEVPGDDRCLVWGTCQWGSVERSMAGDSYREILGHYQPNCIIREVGAPVVGTIKGMVYRNPDRDDRIFPAQVSIEGGPTQVYDGSAAWSFDLDPGTYTIRAEAEGYLPGWVERSVGPFETIWGSIGLDPDPDAGGDAGVDAGQDAGSDAGQDAGQDALDAGQREDEDALMSPDTGCNCGGQAGGSWWLSLLAACLLIRMRYGHRGSWRGGQY